METEAVSKGPEGPTEETVSDPGVSQGPEGKALVAKYEQ